MLGGGNQTLTHEGLFRPQCLVDETTFRDLPRSAKTLSTAERIVLDPNLLILSKSQRKEYRRRKGEEAAQLERVQGKSGRRILLAKQHAAATLMQWGLRPVYKVPHARQCF